MHIKDIKVFSRATCAPCKTVKYYLDKKQRKYSEIDVDQFPDAFSEAIRLSGAITTPQTLITKMVDGQEVKEVVVGWNPTKLSVI